MKIYIVHEYGGEYEDKWDTILGAFTTLEKAQELRDRKKKENDEYSKKEELVEYATPKKPKNWTVGKLLLNRGIEFNCPVCNRLYTERVNFCSSCGQAIDWGKR